MSILSSDHTPHERTSSDPADHDPASTSDHRVRRATDRTTHEPHGANQDRALMLLLLAAERDLRVEMTVNVGSVVVTGTLIGTLAYFRAFADRFSSATGGTEMHAEFADAFRGMFDEMANMTRGDRRHPPDPLAYEQSATFLHLEEARYVTGSGLLPQGRHGVLWRCAVADITGWSVGELIAH